MRHLNVGIETYSGVDLKRCGLYKYAEAPGFALLLLAYSWDGQPAAWPGKATTAPGRTF